MNMNRIRNHWPVSCRDSLAAIDRMSVSEALEIGLITKEESDAIAEEFVMHLTIAMETKGYATAEELHPIPNSEIVRRLRKGLGQEKANGGCSGFPIL